MLDELTQTVARTAQLTPAQATLAVKAVLRFFTARLPSRLVGELYAYLKSSQTAAATGSSAKPDPSSLDAPKDRRPSDPPSAPRD